MTAKKTKKKAEGLTPEELLTQTLKDNKTDHYNFHNTTYYEISQGSLLLDLHVGKITPGVIRHVGVSRGGKTSQMLEDLKQFLKAMPDGRGFWVLAEGRLSEKIKKRSGLKFVYNPEDWVDGSVFVLESNVYELVFDTIRKLLGNNPFNKKYFFVIDSTNGLKSKADLEKGSSEATKVAGGAVMTSDFLSRVTLAMTKFGHILGVIGQVRARPKINQYEKQDPSLSNATGGNALDHYPNIFLQYEPKYKSDIIGDVSDPLGHWAKVIVVKTDNEKTTVVKYPIKYDQDGKGGSVWREYEIADLMLQWGMLTKAGAWLKMCSNLTKELREEGFIDKEDEEFSIQGMDKLREWLEQNGELTDYMFSKFEKLLS
jgi:RecA/RadA recombinase